MLVLVIIEGVSAPVRAVNAVDISPVDALMRQLMSVYSVPGAALALIKDGRIVLEKGYGFRDLEAHAPVTTETLFNIGSISKSFTALGMAQLVDQHKVDLDTPIIAYVPEFRLSDSRVTEAVTLRQLLSHTSGLPTDENWATPSADASRQQIARDMARMPITAQPGTRFQYCSRCFVLAAYVLERVTGQSWEAYTRSKIFALLGMNAASFGSLGLERASDRAQPYLRDVFGEAPAPWTWLDSLSPGGGIDANIADMARYAQFQLGDGTAAGQRVVSEQMLAELHRPEIAAGKGSLTQDIGYALGWYTAEYRGVHLVFHNGVNRGFRANVTLVPSAKAGVVILANADGAGLFVPAVGLSLVEELLGMTPRHDLARELNTVYHFNPRYEWLIAYRGWLRLWPLLSIALLAILFAWRREFLASRRN